MRAVQRGRWTFKGFVAALMMSLLLSSGTQAEERFITLASTLLTKNSGLLDELLPLFQKDSGIAVRVVAPGSTGQALRLAENGSVDVVLVHHRPSEEAFLAAGLGVRRDDVMYNDFLIVGPRNDPARARDSRDALQAFARIAKVNAVFVSRGDDSASHKLELSLWKDAGVDVGAAIGTWYRETGSGMAATLNIAMGYGGYALTDRGTWISLRNKGILQLIFEGDPRLNNQYGVMLVNPARYPNVKAADGQAFIDWLLSERGQQAIANYQIEGQQLYHPNAVRHGR